MKKPIVIMVETKLLSSSQSFTSKEREIRKNKPHIKAIRDKNNNQRIRFFSPK